MAKKLKHYQVEVAVVQDLWTESPEEAQEAAMKQVEEDVARVGLRGVFTAREPEEVTD